MHVPLARRNLLHDKSRFFLSIAGVASSLALILLLMGFREGLYATLTAYVDNVGTDLIVAQSGVKGLFSSNSAVLLSIHDDVAAAANAQEAGHIIVADVIFSRGNIKTPVVLVGYDPETTFGRPWKIGQGRLVAADNEILLDTWLANRSDVEIGDTVDFLGRQFKVAGLTRETASWMSPYVFVSLAAAEEALGLSNTVSYHLLRLPEGAEVEAAAATIEEQFPGVEALTPDSIAEADRRVLATIMDTPINVMLFISVVIGVTIMGLTAYLAVSDQLREYGVLKAIGAGGSRLVRLVTEETLYRAVAGFALGVGLSYATAGLIMAIWPQFTIVIRPETVLQAGLVAIFMTILAALLPIPRLNRIDPVSVFKS